MSIRTERVARLIQKDVADILQTELGNEFRAMVTVTSARMTADLGIAYVYVSVMGDKGQQTAAVRHLKDLAPQVRSALAGRVRHQMRAVPELRFFLDETIEQAQHMDALFARIREERAHREGGSSEERPPDDDAGDDGSASGETPQLGPPGA